MKKQEVKLFSGLGFEKKMVKYAEKNNYHIVNLTPQAWAVSKINSAVIAYMVLFEEN